jgi:hypothetical protein
MTGTEYFPATLMLRLASAQESHHRAAERRREKAVALS